MDGIENTPLMFAGNMEGEELVILLISKGADVNFKNKRGETALDYALEKKNTYIAEILKRARTPENQLTKRLFAAIENKNTEGTGKQ